MAERVARGREDRGAEAAQAGRARGAVRTSRASRRAVRAVLRAAPADKVEGFLFPATYDFLAKTTSTQLVARPADRRSASNWRSVDLAYARSKNLTPYDVLDDRVDGREGDARAVGAARSSPR